MTTSHQICVGYLANTGTVKGLGVFAIKDLAIGDVVEIAPVVQISGDYDRLDEELRRRVFHWERLAKGSTRLHSGMAACTTTQIQPTYGTPQR